jgi:hypothetical protein
MHNSFDLSFTFPDASKLKNISVNIDGITDIAASRSHYDIKAGTYGMNLSLANITTDDRLVYVGSDLFLSGNTYSFDLDRALEEFNDSALSSITGIKIPEDYVGGGKKPSIAEVIQIVSEYREILTDSVECTYIDNREFTIDQKTIDCKGIEVRVERQACNEVLDAMSERLVQDGFEDIFTSRFEDDYVMDVYIGSDGRIINVTTPTDIIMTDAQFSADISFIGEERRTDTIDGGIYVKRNDVISYISLSCNASVDEEAYSENVAVSVSNDNSDDEVIMSYDSEWIKSDNSFTTVASYTTAQKRLALSLGGNISNIVNGEGFELTLDDSFLNVNGKDRVIFCGTYVLSPSDGDIEIPTAATDLLDMSEGDIYHLIFNIIGSIPIDFLGYK